MLTEKKLNQLVHEFHNGGIKTNSTYGLSFAERHAVLKFLLNSEKNPQCYCIKCLQRVRTDNVSPLWYNSIINKKKGSK